MKGLAHLSLTKDVFNMPAVILAAVLRAMSSLEFCSNTNAPSWPDVRARRSMVFTGWVPAAEVEASPPLFCVGCLAAGFIVGDALSSESV